MSRLPFPDRDLAQPQANEQLCHTLARQAFERQRARPAIGVFADDQHKGL